MFEGKPAAVAITPHEWTITEGNRAGCKLDIFELRAQLKSRTANRFKVFAADDAFEGFAIEESNIFDDFELIGESDTREGAAIAKCFHSYIHNIAVFTEYHTHEMSTASKRKLWNAFKIVTAGEVDTKEGEAPAECLPVARTNCSEVRTHQVELNGAVGDALSRGEALIQQPHLQRPRTKLIFDIFIDDPFFD